MPRATRLLLCAAVIAGIVFATAPADAQSPQYIKAFDDGVTEYKNGILSGKFELAKKHFNKAISFEKKYPGPYRYLALIAQIEKQFEECLVHAYTALKLAPKSSNAPAVRKVHGECRKALNRPQLRQAFAGGGGISVQTPSVEDASVRLNGLKFGATPLTRAMATGQVEVCVERVGFLKACEEVELLMGIVVDVIIELKKDPNYKGDGGKLPPNPDDIEHGWLKLNVKPDTATVTFDGTPAKVDSQGRIETKPGTYVVIVEATDHEAWRRRVRVDKGQVRSLEVNLRTTAHRKSLRKKGYMALAGAGVLLAAGAGFGLLERQAFEDAQDIWDTETTRPSGGDTCNIAACNTRADLEDAVSRSKRWAIISGLSYGLAAAALGTSIYFFLQERPAERKGFELPLAITPLVPDSSQGGIGASVTFSTTLDW